MDYVELYQAWKEEQSHKALEFFTDKETKKIPDVDQIAYLHTLAIGGSMDAGLMGLSKWTTPNDIYNSFFNFKKSESKFVFARGHAFEDFVASQFALVTKKEVQNGTTVYGDKFDCPWALAQIDKLLADGTPLEIKVATYNSEDDDGKEWGTGCKFNDNGDMLLSDSQIPKAYYCQCQKQMWLTDKQEMYLAVWLTSEVRIRIYLVKRNDDFINLLKETEIDFLFNHVIPVVPYEEEFEPLSEEHDKNTVFADEETKNYIDELKEINEACSLAEERKKKLTELIKEKIGDYEVVVDEDGKKLCSLTSYESHGFDKKAFSNDHPDLYKQYITKTTSKRLNVVRAKND